MGGGGGRPGRGGGRGGRGGGGVRRRSRHSSRPAAPRGRSCSTPHSRTAARRRWQPGTQARGVGGAEEGEGGHRREIDLCPARVPREVRRRVWAVACCHFAASRFAAARAVALFLNQPHATARGGGGNGGWGGKRRGAGPSLAVFSVPLSPAPFPSINSNNNQHTSRHSQLTQTTNNATTTTTKKRQGPLPARQRRARPLLCRCERRGARRRLWRRLHARRGRRRGSWRRAV